MVESKFMSAENSPESAYIDNRRRTLKAVLDNQQAFIAGAQILDDTPVFRNIPIGDEVITVDRRRGRRRGRRRIRRPILFYGPELDKGFQTVITSLRADLGEDQHTG